MFVLYFFVLGFRSEFKIFLGDNYVYRFMVILGKGVSEIVFIEIVS